MLTLQRKSASLARLEGVFLSFTKARGAYRCLKPKDPIEDAVGLFFFCPNEKCDERRHGVTLLFDKPEVETSLRPIGRWLWNEKPINETTLEGIVFAPGDCGWQGVIRDGEVHW